MVATRRTFLRVVALGGASVSCGRLPFTADAGLLPVGDEDAGSDAGLELDGGATDVDAGTDAGVVVESPDAWPVSSQFSFGIAAGDVTASRVLLATRYDGSAPLRLLVWKMDDDRYAELAADVALQPGDGGFVQLDVQGLTAGARYRYAFVEGGATNSRSALGHFRAAPAPGSLEPVVFGASSCTSNGEAAPLSYASQRDDLAAFFLLGDTAYNDGAQTLAEFRASWHRSLSRASYRALRARVPVVATWDDHEVDNNFDPETTPPATLAAARQAFFEALPIRRPEATPNQLWRSFRWGDGVEVFVLDTRGERKPSTRQTTQEFLSAQQLQWLLDGLATSPCRLKLVLTSVPITDFVHSAFTTDTWRAYQRQRLEVLRFIEDRGVRGVLFVAGDHHFASVGKVSASGVGANALEVLAGPASQTPNPAFRLLTRPRWDFASGDNNYLALHCLPASSEVRLVFHDGRGGVLFDRTFAL